MTFASLPAFDFSFLLLMISWFIKNLTNLTKKEKNGRKIHFDFRPIARYLFLLVEDDKQCISDIFVHRFIQEALGYDVEDISCRNYLRNVVERLKREHPHLTVKSLYALICLYYSPDAFHSSKPIPFPKPKRKADHSALFDD